MRDDSGLQLVGYLFNEQSIYLVFESSLRVHLIKGRPQVQSEITYRLVPDWVKD